MSLKEKNQENWQTIYDSENKIDPCGSAVPVLGQYGHRLISQNKFISIYIYPRSQVSVYRTIPIDAPYKLWR